MSGLEQALDRLIPPPMSDDFVARVMAGIDEAPALPPIAQPRDRRRGWVRGRNLVLGMAGFSLLSAAAAATGLLGERVQNLPVISVIADRIAAKPHPKPALAKPPLAPLPALAEKPQSLPVELAVAPVPEVQAPPEPLPPSARDVRRELMAQNIANRIALREARRKPHGGAPREDRLPPEAREKMLALQPAERRELIARVRQIRQEQQSGLGPSPDRADIVAQAAALREQRRAALAAKRAAGGEIKLWQMTADERRAWRAGLSPEQRQQWREKLRARREARQQWRDQQAASEQSVPTQPDPENQP